MVLVSLGLTEKTDQKFPIRNSHQSGGTTRSRTLDTIQLSHGEESRGPEDEGNSQNSSNQALVSKLHPTPFFHVPYSVSTTPNLLRPRRQKGAS